MTTTMFTEHETLTYESGLAREAMGDGFHLGGTTGTIASATEQLDDLKTAVEGSLRTIIATNAPAKQLSSCASCGVRHRRDAATCPRCGTVTAGSVRARQEELVTALVTAAADQAGMAAVVTDTGNGFQVEFSSNLTGWARDRAFDAVEDVLRDAPSAVDADAALAGFGSDLRRLLEVSQVANAARRAVRAARRQSAVEFASVFTDALADADVSSLVPPSPATDPAVAAFSAAIAPKNTRRPRRRGRKPRR